MIQAVLNNTFGFELTNADFEKSNFSQKLVTNFYIDRLGIIREFNPRCPCCRSSLVVNNGYTSYNNKLFAALQLSIRKGQYLCQNCGHGYVIDLSQFSELSDDFKNTLRSLITSLRLKRLSYHKISQVIHEILGYVIGDEFVREIFNEVSLKIRDITTYTKQSGYYSYDAQYLKIKGREHYRHVVHDLITGKVLIDVVLPKQTNEIIKQVFLRAITCDEIKAFVVDMANGYPKVIKDCYGSKVKIQWCIFHLYQDIGRKYKGYDKKTEDGEFQNELNKQLIYDIFYPRFEQIDYLNKIIGWVKIRRENLKHLDDKIIKKVMKKVRAYFWKKYGELQKTRKSEARRNGNKIVETITEAKIRFERIYTQKQIFPTTIRKVIEKMKTHWDRTTLFLIDKNVPSTNNVAERYFGKTCSKTQKKLFRSVDVALLTCKIHFLQENGTRIYEPSSIFNIINKHSIFFEKCGFGIT
jgi:hypothetical protein